MNLSSNTIRAAAVIDALMQDSYLLVVELRQGTSAQNSPGLRERCMSQIEQVRQSLESVGLSPRSIDLVSHAQCALLDETLLHYAKGDVHADWASEPMQARFFNRHQAGEFLYEDIREVLREPAPDPHVLTAFHRVLMLGFQGRYRDINDAERGQVLAALDARVAPLLPSHALTTRVGTAPRMSLQPWLQSPLLHGLATGLLLVGAWWGLDQWLGAVIATLSPVQA
ncbi:type VI secretion system protein TssL, short form [Pseudomonas gingeri]|uniref:DotU family type IV/VI secretion system protein n=1 Tax=Pseudomonas gingeri TaxID=117681 RepID=A0A7Y7YHE1_9PSED|nr:type VI secretion system protein TssL, short form [Pseudomonas gingeri]NWA04682.1 DotU family type IV/VI secretion system protein [Pseudomonas gingeri]NWA14018.1 DotU family type IV/VI secretion system protein [Pseudomonas gingeri]NWA59126.1 DotU family type IV/VI secretion system protein [Pseudomonas gingeri]NWA99435.1 DotU family type IV/VI secretion system protein [Pseudomonas gingeri]NWB05809.1 DotU family type IV/VI secretion system protein [Pseudomonas gingeri]